MAKTLKEIMLESLKGKKFMGNNHERNNVEEAYEIIDIDTFNVGDDYNQDNIFLLKAKYESGNIGDESFEGSLDKKSLT
jgi:hypothetical protein